MTSEVLQTIATIAATLTALGVIGVAIRLVYKFAKRLEAAIGHDKEGRSLSERLVRVEHQVFPNGGGSLSDQVDEIHKSLIAIETKTEMIESLLVGNSIHNANASSNNNKRPGRSPRETASAPTAQTNKNRK